VLTDCGVCHIVERPIASLNHLLSGLTFAPVYDFDDSVPAAERGRFVETFLELIDQSSIAAVEPGTPNAAEVSIRLSVVAEAANTDLGAPYFAARGRAVLRLHRALVEVESAPGVSRERDEAIRLALAKLADKVYLALTW
jgi:hypothetical protein